MALLFAFYFCFHFSVVWQYYSYHLTKLPSNFTKFHLTCICCLQDSPGLAPNAAAFVL